ncbi:MAG: methylmalonyl-CoA epimerase [Bacteroidota bacterium]|jgi:methylmalonyl-CoA/ethylmalonyl-CoA epimerase|nr:methylmalonyl-CoA epimerase [Sphingobacteriia bacterium]
MNFKQVEHIGIAVSDLNESKLLYEKLLGCAAYKDEFVNSEQVWTSFFKTGTTKLELLYAEGENHVINRFIAKRGEGIHHIAFLVDNLNAEMDRLKAAGFTFIQDAPKDGADNKRIIFLHPKQTGGILVELCEERI